MKDKNSLAHSAWNCKYHIVVPVYIRTNIGDFYMILGVIIFSIYTLILRIKPKEMPHHVFFYLIVQQENFCPSAQSLVEGISSYASV